MGTCFPWAFPMGVAHGQGGNDLRPNYSRAPGFQMLLGLIEIGFQPNVVLDMFSMGVAHGYGDNDLRSNCYELKSTVFKNGQLWVRSPRFGSDSDGDGLADCGEGIVDNDLFPNKHLQNEESH